MTKKILLIVSTIVLLTSTLFGMSVAANAYDSTPKPRHLTGAVHPPQINQPHKLPKNIDGCDRNYGAQHQCVPMNLPSGAAGCAYLTKHHFKNLKVTVTDDKKLDSNGDKIACN